MFILPEGATPAAAHARLLAAAEKSRFTFRAETEPARHGGRGTGGRDSLRLRMIRLRRAKHYCGQHAGPCPANPLFEAPHRACRYLEGADWVAFDDMINDVLDRHRIEARVWSKGTEFLRPYFIRRGRARRTAYGAVRMTRHGGRLVAVPDDYPGHAFWVWDPDEANGAFADSHFGARADAPRSSFPAGTPGIPEWRLSRSRRLQRLLGAVPGG